MTCHRTEPWKMKVIWSLEWWELLSSVTVQQTQILISTTVRTSNLGKQNFHYKWKQEFEMLGCVII